MAQPGNIQLNGYNGNRPVNAWRAIMAAFPNTVQNAGELVLLEEQVNLAKERAFNNIRDVNDATKMKGYIASDDTVDKAIRNVKVAILAYK